MRYARSNISCPEVAGALTSYLARALPTLMAVQNMRATASRVTREVSGSVVMVLDVIWKIYFGTQVKHHKSVLATPSYIDYHLGL